MVNYIADTNRFKLPTPPQWFLQRLYDFDAQLVLVPSRVKAKGATPAYLLTRRRVRTAGIGDVAMLDNKHPDTNMCYAHGLLPIGPLRFNNGVTTFTQSGCDSLLAELKRRDTWAVTGGDMSKGDKLVDAIEYAEEIQARNDRASLRDMFYHKGRDAYRSLKARTGQRNKRASDRHGVAAKPPTSQRVILTDAK